MTAETTPTEPPHMSDADLKAFVQDVLSGQVFTSAQVPEGHGDMLRMIFLPIAFGALQGLDFTKLGCLYEYESKALPRSINGYPIFSSCHIMHMDDWKRAVSALKKAQAQLDTIEV